MNDKDVLKRFVVVDHGQKEIHVGISGVCGPKMHVTVMALR